MREAVVVASSRTRPGPSLELNEWNCGGFFGYALLAPDEPRK